MPIHAAIIGVHKCGTSALLEMFRRHPRASVHFTGQAPPFLHEEDPAAAFERIRAECFDDGDPAKRIVLRDTRLYLEPRMLAELHALSPGAHLILAVRDPVSRAYSAFRFAQSKGVEVREEFRAVIAAQEEGPYDRQVHPICNYVRMGQYYRNLKDIETVFPRSHIHVVRADQLKDDANRTFRQICEFIGLDPIDMASTIVNETRQARSERFAQFLRREGAAKRLFRAVLPLRARMGMKSLVARLNATGERPPQMDRVDAERLREIFRPDSERLLAEYGVDVMRDWPGT